MEKVKLEVKGMEKSKQNSLEILCDLNDSFVKLVKKEGKMDLKKLRVFLHKGRRDYGV